MSSLQVDNIQTYNSNPPVIKNVSGTEVGTFCRAWVNFNGTGTVAIRASFNVSSITDSGVGQYTVNFTTAMPDTNFIAITDGSGGSAQHYAFNGGSGSTGSIGVSFAQKYLASSDPDYFAVAIFR